MLANKSGASRWLAPFLNAWILERRATHRVAPTKIFSVYSSHSDFSVVEFSYYLPAFASVSLWQKMIRSDCTESIASTQPAPPRPPAHDAARC